MLIIIYAFLCPLLITSHNSTFMANLYAKKPARVEWLKEHLGICDGGVNRAYSERGLQSKLAIGVAAMDLDGKTNVTVSEAMESPYMPMIKYSETDQGYKGRIDTFLEVGFIIACNLITFCCMFIIFFISGLFFGGIFILFFA